MARLFVSYLHFVLFMCSFGVWDSFKKRERQKKKKQEKRDVTIKATTEDTKSVFFKYCAMDKDKDCA